MNILISTTTNWNPGDQWILRGVKNILKHIFIDPSYIHYDRNPDYMVSYPVNQNMKEGFHSNIMNSDIDWEMIDLVVLAGSPEFLHHPLANIYEGLHKNKHIPLWAIGVGYSYPDWAVPITEIERDVLKRGNTIIITRQMELSERLEIETGRKIPSLPCPALFCFEDFPIKTKELLLIPQDKVELSINADVAFHCLKDINGHGYFSSDAYELLDYLGQYKKVISQRLHGTIAAISAGAYSVLENESFRAKEGIKLFDSVIESSPEKILKFKQETFIKYLNIFQNGKAS